MSRKGRNRKNDDDIIDLMSSPEEDKERIFIPFCVVCSRILTNGDDTVASTICGHVMHTKCIKRYVHISCDGKERFPIVKCFDDTCNKPFSNDDLIVVNLKCENEENAIAVYVKQITTKDQQIHEHELTIARLNGIIEGIKHRQPMTDEKHWSNVNRKEDNLNLRRKIEKAKSEKNTKTLRDTSDSSENSENQEDVKPFTKPLPDRKSAMNKDSIPKNKKQLRETQSSRSYEENQSELKPFDKPFPEKRERDERDFRNTKSTSQRYRNDENINRESVRDPRKRREAERNAQPHWQNYSYDINPKKYTNPEKRRFSNTQQGTEDGDWYETRNVPKRMRSNYTNQVSHYDENYSNKKPVTNDILISEYNQMRQEFMLDEVNDRDPLPRWNVQFDSDFVIHDRTTINLPVEFTLNALYKRCNQQGWLLGQDIGNEDANDFELRKTFAYVKVYDQKRSNSETTQCYFLNDHMVIGDSFLYGLIRQPIVGEKADRFEVANSAFTGPFFSTPLAKRHIEMFMNQRTPRNILLSFGSHDLRMEPDINSTFNNVMQLIKMLIKRGTKIILIIPTYVTHQVQSIQPIMNRTRLFNHWLQTTATNIEGAEIKYVKIAEKIFQKYDIPAFIDHHQNPFPIYPAYFEFLYYLAQDIQ